MLHSKLKEITKRLSTKRGLWHFLNEQENEIYIKISEFDISSLPELIHFVKVHSNIKYKLEKYEDKFRRRFWLKKDNKWKKKPYVIILILLA